MLQVLFAADSASEDPTETLELLEKHFSSDDEEIVKMHRVSKEFASKLVDAVTRDKGILDKLISQLSHNWKLHRINRVDRNILRMAMAEFIDFPETPGRVILNEAIEIGKKFGADNSAAFINGILDRVQTLEARPTSAAQLQEILGKLDESESTG